MSLITQKSQLEQDLADKDASVLRVAAAYHHAATVQISENNWFWSLPTERLLALLNHDIALTLGTFSANTGIGVPNNAMLDAVGSPDLPRRAPVEPGRTDIVFDGTAFIYVAPPEPEPEPAPE